MEAMVGCWQVNPHHQDLVTAVLPLAVGGQQQLRGPGERANFSGDSARHPG
jgi:hypothetical protein